MKQIDLDRAFPKTPDCIPAAIEIGFRQGQKKMKMRYKFMYAASAAAVLLVMIAVAALAMGVDRNPAPDVLAQPVITDTSKSAEETNPYLEADNELRSGDSMVYATASGKYYHIDQHCSGMEDALYLPMTKALEQGKGACPICIPETSPLRDFSRNPLFVGEPELIAEEAMFWCTEKGNYYHTDQHCSGMEGAIYATLSYALALDKTPCPVCITGSEDVARNSENISVYAAYGKPLYYHIAEICNGQQNKRELTIADAEKEQLLPCPDCYAVIIAEENTETAEPVFYCTPNGRYYHYEPDCSGMLNAEACAPEQAIINSGKNACPVCFNSEDRKALYMLPAPRYDTDEVYCSAENSYYHIDPNCFSVTSVSKMDLLSARDSAKTPCPVCLKEQADISALETCWSTKHGRYFHSDEYCSGMLNAISGLVEEARSAG